MKTYTKYHQKFVSLLCLVTLLATCLLTGCSNAKKETTSWDGTTISDSQFLLNTIVQITLYDSQDENILKDTFTECSKYENIFSRTLPTSELYKLNARELPQKDGRYEVSDDLAALIERALYYSELSGGAFDLTIAPVSSLWDFTSDVKNPTLPDVKTINEQLQHIDYNKVHINGNQVWFDDDKTTLDLGAIAKGYIADKLKQYLISRDVKSAMINLGGNVLCVGEKPNGASFNVGIQKPFADRNETTGIMQIKDLSVVSSGIYERFITVNGKDYHHILNPKTGYPYDNNLIAVTIISKNSVDGDGLSTTTFALGLEKGLDLINNLDEVDAVFITDDYKLHYSDKFQEHINLTQQ